MKSTKLIFFDIDDTLCRAGELDENNHRTLRQLHCANIKLAEPSLPGGVLLQYRKPFPSFIIDADYHKKYPVYQCSVLLSERQETEEIDAAFAGFGLQLTCWQKAGVGIFRRFANLADNCYQSCYRDLVDLAIGKNL